MNSLKQRVIDNITFLNTLDVREYTLYNKYFECLETYKENGQNLISDVYNNLMGFDDICEFMSREKNDIKILKGESEHVKEDWFLTRKLVHSMPFDQNPGRNLKYIIYINGKIAGVISLASDLMSLKTRDEYIGWSKDDKLFGKHKLNNTAVASTILPVQPLGYLCAGGKLLSLLLHSDVFREDWYDFYQNPLVGMTTTSLFGPQSQYCGMQKYWKSCGVTSGKTPLSPRKDLYKEMIEWLKENHNQEYKSLFEEQVNKKGEVYKKSTPKYHVINLFYEKNNFKEYFKNNNMNLNDLSLMHQRGVYFARFYENTNEFLCDKIDEKDLKSRSNLDFDTNDYNQIVNYWKRKWATKRFNKKCSDITEDEKKKFYINLDNVNNVNDFIKKYYSYDPSTENLDDKFKTFWSDLI